MGDLHDILQFIGKDAAVPQCSLCDILFATSAVGFSLKVATIAVSSDDFGMM